jgi:hypothetical protein
VESWGPAKNEENTHDDPSSKITCNVRSAGRFQGDCTTCLANKNEIKDIEQRLKSNNKENRPHDMQIVEVYGINSRINRANLQKYSIALFRKATYPAFFILPQHYDKCISLKKWSWNFKLRKVPLHVISLKAATSSCKTTHKALIITTCRKLFIHMWRIIHIKKWMGTSELLWRQIL